MSAKAPARWLNTTAALGHCEVDWQKDLWSISPPVIARLPYSDGLGILVGARRARLLRAIDESDLYTERAAREPDARRIPPPDTLLLPFSDERDLIQAAEGVGAAYVGNAAGSIADLLGQEAPPESAAQPAHDSVLERLANLDPPNWRRVSPKEPLNTDGLYREHYRGRWHYKLRKTGSWFRSDLSHGIYAELDRRDQNVFRWQADSRDRAQVGTFLVYQYAPLPPLQTRALTLCSGFNPRYSNEKRSLLYHNVPRSIGNKVAASLHQKFQVISQD
ncbi:hypothetical protein AB0P16_05845 [Dietzia maris]|uniref:hypothetical protein n=1 Tax=Dietzia maris TaxID=37915 RepID=UPI0034379216